jgi:MFS family permease
MIGYFRKFDRRLWVLALGWVASAIGFSLAIPFMAIYFHSELGLSLSSIGLFFGVAAIVRASTQAVAGELSDKLGRYRIMVVAQMVRTVLFFFLSYAIFRDWGFLPVAAILIGNSIFGALFQPAANATVADLVDIDNRPEGYAIVRIAGNLGWAIGPAVGGFLATNSYALLFIFSGCMTLVSSTIIALFLKGITQVSANDEPFRLKDIFSYRGNELIFHHVAIVLILYLVIAQLMAPFSLYSVELMGITKAQLGILFTLNGLLVTFLQLPTTKILRPLRLTTQLLIGSLIYAVGYFIVGFSSVFVLFVIVMIIITIGENCVSPPALSLTANLAPKGRTGRYMGIYGFAVTFGWSMGPLLGGALLDWTAPDYLYTWIIISALAIVSAVGFVTLSGRLPIHVNKSRQPFNE